MPEFTLTIINLDDTKDSYDVNPFMSVEYLMRLISERTHATEFRLVKGRVFLENEKSLMDYDITPDDTLIMIANFQIMKRVVPETMVIHSRILPIMTKRPNK
jgi:hypothetical protein